jgi:hypothetical protein
MLIRVTLLCKNNIPRSVGFYTSVRKVLGFKSQVLNTGLMYLSEVTVIGMEKSISESENPVGIPTLCV